MPLTFPEPPDEKLFRSPIELVVWQLRFSELPQVESLDIGLAFHEKLGGKDSNFPRMARFEEGGINVQLGPAAPSVTPARNVGWRFASSDRDAAITLTPGSLAVETKNYDRWKEGFAAIVNLAIAALESAVPPDDELRLGLRYIDRIKGLDVETPNDWAGWLKPWALGAAADGDLAGGVGIAETGTILQIDEEIDAKERVSLARDDEGAFAVIDVDVSRTADEGERDFDAGSIADTTERLHTHAKQLFLATIEPKLYEYLREKE